jgi:radical SAM protein with 4Fe4S-binding SPASM domain
MLVHVDRDFMRDLGCQTSPLWGKADDGLLSAPLEVHFSVTNSCLSRCRHCYMDSGQRDLGEMDGDDFRRAIDILADIGVFHVALGGGEALERSDFFELAAYVRSRGIVPNLTTNGHLLTKETAAKCGVFGQVNVSVDWINPTDDCAVADGVRGIDPLQEAGVNVGLNCVVTRQNFGRLAEVLAYAGERGLTDVELLRFKPSGRGKLDYFERRLTPAQNRDFLPMIKHLSQQYAIPVKIDCSFVPMFCWHRPDKALMEQFSVYGCEAANVLLGVRSNGQFGGCSFLPGTESVFDLPELWTNSANLAHLRKWTESACEPCRSCAYLEICKGGCRAVAAFVTNDQDAPDPECPFVDDVSRNQ